MLQIGMIVKILPDAEYSGKFTGYIGKVKNYFSQNKKVGVELFQQTNDASSKGLFWFSESKVVAAGSLPDAMMEYIKADLNATFGVANHIRRSRQTGLPQNKKVGVELFQQTNDASSKGLFWFSESKVVAAGSLPDAMMEYIKADLNATFGVANHIRRSRQTGLPQIKKVIYSGPKTIILWADNTKTIVSCGEADSYDYYSGFCAAVVKKLFSSTTHAKKVLGDSIQIND